MSSPTVPSSPRTGSSIPTRFAKPPKKRSGSTRCPIDISWQPKVHLVDVPDSVAREIGKFDANTDVNSLRVIDGQVTKKTKKQPLLTSAVFVCQRCGAETEVPQGETGFQEPYECEACERQGPFKLDADKSSKVNHQQVRVQLPPEVSAGGSSEHIDVTLLDEVVESAEVGDRVNITARMSTILPDENAEKPLLEWHAEGQHVEQEESGLGGPRHRRTRGPHQGDRERAGPARRDRG